MDLLGLGEEDYLLCLSPPSYFTPSVVPATATTTAAASASTCCAASYLDLDLAPAYHHTLSFAGQDQEQQHHGDGALGFQHYGGDHAIPAAAAAVQQKSSPTTECSSSLSSMSPSPPATAAVSCPKQQAFKKKKAGSRSSASAAAPAATNKRPRVRRERLGERIVALQQLVSPFGKSDTASVLHEALGYIRFLHDQVQVLSTPYMQMQRQPASAHVPESAAGTVVEAEQPDLRSRGLCLVPVSCTEHIAGNDSHGNGADLWSSVLLPLPLPGGGSHPSQGRLA